MFNFRPVWFDSLGAKSSCVFVKTPDIRVVIDPGIAIMHPSFPASWIKKLHWLKQGMVKIIKTIKESDVVIISHYHYDHYLPEEIEIYKNKTVFIKNPNIYINDSQRSRAEEFFQKVCKSFGRTSLMGIVKTPEKRNYPDPMKDIPLARKKSFGDYTERREKLLSDGEKWFKNRIKLWNKRPFIPELRFSELKIIYPEGKEFVYGRTRIRFTQPLFHGIEFSRVGWIFATVIEYGKKKLIHSSDMNGPIIEDYAEWIIKEDPDVLFLDGPPTYLIPYMMNMINFRRALNNICRIIKKTNTELIILDHHLLREKGYKRRLKEAYELAKKEKKTVITAAEYIGEKPVIDSL